MRMFQALHKYYDDCFSDGEFDRDKVIENGLIDSNYNTNERLNLLESVYNMILKAKFLNSLTIDYITHSNRNYDDIINKYNEDREDALDMNSGRSRITFCQRKIAEVLTTVSYDGEELNFITWLFKDKAHMGINLDPEKIDLRNEFIRQYNRFNDLYGETLCISKKDLLINIPTYEKVNELSEEKFNDFMDIIQPYSKYMLSVIQNEINSRTEEVGYFRFLMSKSSKLSDIDRERKDTILRWLGKKSMNIDELVSIDSENNNDTLDEDKKEIINDIGDIFK